MQTQTLTPRPLAAGDTFTVTLTDDGDTFHMPVWVHALPEGETAESTCEGAGEGDPCEESGLTLSTEGFSMCPAHLWTWPIATAIAEGLPEEYR